MEERQDEWGWVMKVAAQRTWSLLLELTTVGWQIWKMYRDAMSRGDVERAKRHRVFAIGTWISEMLMIGGLAYCIYRWPGRTVFFAVIGIVVVYVTNMIPRTQNPSHAA